MADPTGSQRRPVEILPAEIPSLRALLSLAVFVVSVAGLYLAREILIPVVLAALMSFILAPLANLLRRLRLGKTPSVIVAVVLALGVVLAVGGLIGTQLADLAKEAPRYQATIQKKIDTVRTTVTTAWSEITGRLKPVEAPAADKAAQPKANAGKELLAVEVHQPDPTPLQVAETILAPVVSPLTTLGVVFIVSIFVLLQREDLRNRLIRLFGSRDLHRTTIAMDDAATRLSRYFLTQFAINASFGVIIAVALYFMGVPSPVLWGLIAALLRFVPYVGAVLSALGPIALAAAVDPGWTLLLWTGALFLVVETVMGQVVEPLLYSHSTGLSAISVVVAAIFWTWLWGPIGLVLSTPLTMCLVVLGRHVERLEFLDVMLGDKPPLTPVETLYQHLLAGDADEAIDYAEQALQKTSLGTYYDDVVLPGLQLASSDMARGVMGTDQVERISATVEALIGDLSSYATADKAEKAGDAPGLPPSSIDPQRLPAAWRSETPVLALAGRGSLDETAAVMLTQVLAARGLKARTAAYDTASRNGIATLDLTGIAMICVCYLDIEGSPSHLRFLLRRLRQRAPEVPIVVGFWAADDPMLTQDRLQTLVGADNYVATLENAAKACLAAAGVEPAAAAHAEPETRKSA